MFVEKLSLFGFKSFNQKVSLTFGQGISGVIGPNGCGKSNIVDAMRWVLGEQSTKQLRGAKMEDVIFNGSRSEKPMSLAEVELILNNDRGMLPIDYTTVRVGRRLYRSGNSEYFINRNQVRLKDVRELFLDTGMGSHAYSVIERQMVDNILSDTTGHRRFLFEEAAGIMKYKTRKKEALSKLEATEGDLLRVNDIISEVERQVNSLRRQVGKARRYREFTEEIRNLDLGLSQLRRSEWMEQIRGLEARFNETRREAESSETEVATLESNLQELHLRVLDEERKLGSAREALADVDDDLGRAGGRIEVLRERLDSTQRRIVEARDLGVRLSDRLDRNATSTVDLEDRLGRLDETEAVERASLDEGEQELKTAEIRVRELRDQATQAQQLTLGFLEQKVRAEGAVESVGGRIADLDQRLGTLDDRLEALRREEREHAAALEVSNENVRGSRDRVASVEHESALVDAEWRNHHSRVELVRKELSAAREEEAAVRSRLDTLEALRARYEGFAPGVRALMLGEDRPEGVLGTLSDLVSVPGDWVRALEPALSTAWQYVVTRDTATALDLVGKLESDGLGFASLLPLDRVPARETPSGDVNWASEALDVDEAYRPLLRYLIGDLALVETLDDAMDLVTEGRALRAATQRGQYVDAAVIAGGEGGPAGSELLEREEGMTRCRADIEGLVGQLSALTEREGELGEEHRSLEAREGELRGELDRAREALKALEKEQAQLALQVRHTANALSEVDESRGKLGLERNRLVEKRDLLQKALEESLDRSQVADREHRDLSEVLAEAETVREEVLGRVHGQRLSWARLESEMRDSRASLSRLTQEKQDLLAEQERSIRDEQEASGLKVEIEGELEDLASRVQELHGQRNERLAVVGERERSRGDVAAVEQQESERLREIRRRAGTAREAAHGAEVELTQVRGELRHLEERLREEYEVGPEDLDRVALDAVPGNAAERLGELKERLRRLGPVNPLALEEFEEKKERFDFMSTQRDDLQRAKGTLLKTIEEINKKASGMFLETFAVVQENFQKTFKVLFQGGECSLTLTGDDPLEADIDVVARPRGKRPQGIQQLSSGERALTAIALLFAIYLVKPSPFCILDEVDAPLDDANIDRFVAMIKEFSKRTQFIMITHNKKTMEAADCLYGVTMQSPGVSSVVSVRLDAAEELDAFVDDAVSAEAGNGGGNGNGRSADEEDPLSPESVIAQ